MNQLPIRVLALGLSVALWTTAVRGDDDTEIKLTACPVPVQKTIQAESKGARIDKVSKETEDGKTTFWAVFISSTKHYEMAVAEDGTLQEISMEADADEVPFNECPAAVQKALHFEAKGTKIETVGKDVKYGGTIYAAIVAIGNREYEIVVAHDGMLIEKSLIIDEDEIELDKCPAAVQKAFKDQAHDGKIGSITRSTGIDGHVYETEIEIQDKVYVVEVNEGGILISKLLDDAGE